MPKFSPKNLQYLLRQIFFTYRLKIQVKIGGICWLCILKGTQLLPVGVVGQSPVTGALETVEVVRIPGSVDGVEKCMATFFRLDQRDARLVGITGSSRMLKEVDGSYSWILYIYIYINYMY